MRTLLRRLLGPRGAAAARRLRGLLCDGLVADRPPDACPRRRAATPGRRWNALPYLEPVTDPKIVHWAAGGKPWWAQLAPYQDSWRDYDARLRARVGAPPEHREPPTG